MGTAAMNKDNILKVADAIEQHSIPDLGFNMDFFSSPRSHGSAIKADHSGHDCGTVACIAGWAVQVGDLPRTFAAARQYLGIDDDLGDDLFYGDSDDLVLADIAVPQAVAVLRYLAETGEVDWSVGAPAKAA